MYSMLITFYKFYKFLYTIIHSAVNGSHKYINSRC